jgi:hypothetical protein
MVPQEMDEAAEAVGKVMLRGKVGRDLYGKSTLNKGKWISIESYLIMILGVASCRLGSQIRLMYVGPSPGEEVVIRLQKGVRIVSVKQ